ncbi:multidrug efflux SMR transporter [Sphingobacterium sp. UT-1RO-CII-1]|uniref:DMT family transporter n=1 Tax=Sphingobacterium sp. UT-1RO-CII-1 TaxID=2995225 RepID=UPI00227A5C96|nr:multidrug efflux SMR transporter [Sphingobacterium sp. UT-1RO-CII-1]MCY4781272.1 multidrug efflux SMR transporter [Sphingobacterium sp. UT-1RO-CII-1]
MKHYLFLAAAILFEVVGTSFLKKTEQFSKPVPSIIFICSLALSFYLLTYALKGVPMGIAYAIWSAFGIVIISAVGYFVYKETLDLPAILGIALIVIGVVIINLFSKSSAH